MHARAPLASRTRGRGIATGPLRAQLHPAQLRQDGAYAQPSAKPTTSTSRTSASCALAQSAARGLRPARERGDHQGPEGDARALRGDRCSTQSRAPAAAAASARDELLDRLAEGILTKLPPDFDLEEAEAQFPGAYLESMNTVLVQELIRFNRLTAIVRKSLASCARRSRASS